MAATTTPAAAGTTSGTDLAAVAAQMADAQKTSFALAGLTTQNETAKAISQAIMDSHRGLAR